MGSETFKGLFLGKILRDLGTVELYFLCLELCFNFLLINIENIKSLLLVSLLILSRYAWLVTEIGG